MLIDCPNCARSYHVGRGDIGENGRAVVCPRCNTSWYVAGERAPGLPSPQIDLKTTAVSRRAVPNLIEPARKAGLFRRCLPAFGAAACLALVMGGIAAREKVVRLVPRTEGIYATAGMPVNVQGLSFAEITPKRSDPASGDVTISGSIRNIAARRVVVPRLTYQVRDADGAAVASWTEAAPARTLAVGKSLSFASTPHQVPAEGRTITVRFESDDEAPEASADSPPPEITLERADVCDLIYRISSVIFAESPGAIRNEGKTFVIFLGSN